MSASTSYHGVAVTRAKELWSRLVFAAVAGGATYAATRSLWVPVWLLAVVVVQAVDHTIAAPFRQANAAPSRARRGAYFASVVFSTSLFSAMAPLAWFQGGLEGHLIAFVIAGCGLLNVALHAQAAPRLMMAACTAHGLYLIVPPIISLALDHGDNEIGMAFVVIGGLLFLTHFVIVVQRNTKAARTLAEALSEAQAERLRAENANAAKSEFLATMSHEIRTPLNGVLGMAQAMAAAPLPDDQRKRLDVVRQSGEVLLALLNDLLDVSKIEAERLELEDGLVDMGEIADLAHGVFAPLADGKKIGLRIRLTDVARAPRRGDPMRVRQVLYNLIGNAVKFTEQGRVTVLISGDDTELVIEVSDTGAGIPHDRLVLLFERFSQADASTTRRYGGSGLGLAISRGLARLMGGDITVRSIVDEGTTFTARLVLPRTGEPAKAKRKSASPVEPPPPRAEPAPALDPAPAAVAEEEAGDELRILAAEDNPTNQLVLKTLLEQVGVTPHVVDNGLQALEAWKSGDWHLILMDIQMPEMDGVSATRAIREIEAREGRPRTPILALTANAMAHQAAEYTAVGMDALVPKPIQFERLIAAIQAALEPAAEPDAALAEAG